MKRGLIALTALAASSTAPPARAQVRDETDMSAYLLVYFKDATHDLYMALSSHGYSFTDVNQGEPILVGDTVAMQKGIRDPHISRGPDGAFYLAMTDLHIFARQQGLRDTRWEREGAEYAVGEQPRLRADGLQRDGRLPDVHRPGALQ